MFDRLKVSEVFVPGKLPEHTYNPRSELELELQLQDYLDETGSILTVAGPTKTGKSVLLRRVISDPVWVDGQGVDSVDELWRRVGDQLAVYTELELGTNQGTTGKGSIQGEAGIPVVKGRVGSELSLSEGSSVKYAVERPIGAAVRQALESSDRALVVDDFHFIDRDVQRQIVRALKPLVLAGVPIIFVSISHRVQDAVTAEPDMTGRVTSLPVKFWSEDELLVIARKGFSKLRVTDPDDAIGRTLARESYGSPHLMQKFCREACKQDGVRETSRWARALNPPSNWREFFARQTDDASGDWFQRLLRGPQERGSLRTKWTVKDGRRLDGYGLTLLGIANTGPKLTLRKDEIRRQVDLLVEGAGPAAHQTTRVLQHMTRIAAKRASTEPITAEQLDREIEEPQAVSDVQPVLEYMEEGPNSALHIADPFFAFYLKWGSDVHLTRHSEEQGEEQDDELADE